MQIFARPRRAQVIALLAACGLPFEDLHAEQFEHFFGCGTEDDTAGVVGIEIHGAVALLRSLAVATTSRGLGLGKVLVAAVEDHAKQKGVKDIYLLTTSARRIFESLGYQEVARECAPDPIRTSPQFSTICPASATFMWKRVEHVGLASPRGAS